MIDRHTGRVYCIAETPSAMLVRLKGTRQVLALPWPDAYLKAAMLKAAETKANKVKRTFRRGALRRG